MEKKWAIISVMSREHGYDSAGREHQRPWKEQVYEVVHFYETEREASEAFGYPQGQTFESGEIQRYMVHVEANWATVAGYGR